MSKNQVQQNRDIKRKKKFLQQLAISSHVAQSAKAANIATSTLYLWREKDPAFREDWMQALAAGYELLEMELLHRARNGTDKPVFHGGKIVATVKDYDNGLAFRLLVAHRNMVAKTRAAEAELTDQRTELRQTLDQKINAMRRRLAGRERFKPSMLADRLCGSAE